jgi:hypothetical protein
MKLDRNVDGGHGNKYALVKNRRLEELRGADGTLPAEISHAMLTLCDAGVLDWGATPETEFFVIRLRDKCARAALCGYAYVAETFDREYSGEVMTLAQRSGPRHPNCKAPD